MGWKPFPYEFDNYELIAPECYESIYEPPSSKEPNQPSHYSLGSEVSKKKKKIFISEVDMRMEGVLK